MPEFVDNQGLPQCVAPQVVQKPIHRCHYVGLAIGEGRPELMTCENTMIKIAPGKRLKFTSSTRNNPHARDSALRRLSRHQNLCTPREYPRGYLDQPIGTDRAPS